MQTTGIWLITAVVMATLLFLLTENAKQRCSGSLRFLFWLLEIVAAIGMAYFFMCYTHVLTRKLTLPGFALYAALFGMVLSELVCSLQYLFRRRKLSRTAFRILSAAVFSVLLLYGTCNALVIRRHTSVYSSEKLTREHVIVFLSDAHAGRSQPPEVLEKAVKEIREMNPELILLGGDITDEYTTKEEMERIYALFGSTDIPTYLVFGNHDRQNSADTANGRQYSVEELESAIQQNGIVLLKDSFIKVSDDLVLLGREDMSDENGRKESSELINPSPEAFFLTVDHSPYETDAAFRKIGMDLQLSGHSHAGQLFPLCTVFELAGYECYREYRHGNTVLYVSPGTSGWGYPFRTDKHCEYEVLTLRPAEN